MSERPILPSTCLFLSSICIYLLTSATLASAGELTSFSPVGSVKNVQQVRAQFATDMIAMGDTRTKQDPFKIKCNQKTMPDETGEENESGANKKTPAYKTRWADSRNWLLEFNKPLPSGWRCEFTLKDDARDLKGEEIAGGKTYSFLTAGPAILNYAPRYMAIQPDQYFILQTDGPVDPKSAQEKAYFEVQGFPDKVKVKLIQGQERDNLLAHIVKTEWQWDSFRPLLKSKKPVSKIKEFDAFLVLGATRRFPEKARVVLHWPNGLLSKSGLPVTEPQDFTFDVIESFSAKFSCDRVSPERACNPILPLRLDFTRPIPYASLKGTKLTAKNGQTWIPDEMNEKKTKKPEETLAYLSFPPPFPEKAQFQLVLPKNLKDELGRPLTNQKKFPLAVATDEFSPLVKFAAPFGVLERKADPILPVSLRNVEAKLAMQQMEIPGKSLRLSNLSQAKEVLNWYQKVIDKDGSDMDREKPLLASTKAASFQLPKPSGPREFELIGVPLKNPGFYIVELGSPKLGAALLGSKESMFVATAVLVTDLSAHMKIGRESSLVWVTQLSDAKPVGDATVVIMDRQGNEWAKGKTDSSGIFRTGALKKNCSESSDEESGDCTLFAFVQKDDDFSFVSSAWQKGIESYRFNVSQEYLDRQWGPVVVHSVLDRMVAKAGDVIHMKHFLREHTQQGFAMMNPSKTPKRVFVVHQGSRKTYTLPFEFDAKTGTAVGEFRIPASATLGRYSIYVSNKDKIEGSEDEDPFDWTAQESGHFYVSDYRLPLMKASVKIQGQPLIRPTSVNVDLSASYLSGGPAKNLKVKVRSTLQPGSFTPDVPGASEFRFFSEPLQPGVQNSEDRVTQEETFLKITEVTLSKDGGALATIKDLPRITKNQDLTVEMEYMDPNGETKTAVSQVPVFPSQLIVGLKSDTWISEGGKAKVDGVITDTKGKPLAKKPYTIEAFKTENITHRKRLVGGFYSYDSKSIVTALGPVCQGQSDQYGRFECEPKNLKAGRVTLQAKVTDDKGHSTYANTEIDIYETGKYTWWTPSDSDRIDILPEKTRYEPGENAKFVIRTPYQTATVLITVEREGVLDAFVREVKRDNPIIEVPIKGHYAPNIFVSALLVRGRVGDPQPTALLDLARPVMKMGLTDIDVNWKAHELQVEVKPERKVYHPRENLKAVIAVKDQKGQPASGAEVTVAIVDEALMRLKENESWNLLAAMMGKRSLAVSTSSMQNQVIGRRHFGSKAKAPGGGGGQMENPRELFEPVLLWEARLKLDSKGEARVQVPVNDSMTSFRIVAVAAKDAGLFGSGQANVESTKDLILLSGFAPLAREGDSLNNVFTIRNTTAKPMKISVTGTSPQLSALPKIPDFELKGSEAKTLNWPVTVPKDLKEVTLVLKARDTNSGATDQVQTKVRVEPAVPEKVMQATLFQLKDSHRIPVRQPADALPGRGSLQVDAKSTLVAGLAGVRSYMDDYPYTCLEQRVSKSIALEKKDETKKLVEDLPGYFDGSGLLKFFPNSMCGSAQLSRYVLNILQENEFALPPATQQKALEGLRSYLMGKEICHPWWDRFIVDSMRDQENILVMETLARYRSLTQSDLAMVKVTPNLWRTETVTAWLQILSRLPDLPKQKEMLEQAHNILKSRVNFQGTLMNLQDNQKEQSTWRLFTSADQEALGAFAWAINDPSWQQDAGRMARGLVARLKSGHWDTTMANAWGVTQFRKFSQKYENEKVSGETSVTADEQKAKVSWSQSPQGATMNLAWPAASITKDIAVEFKQSGSGQPWISLQTRSAIPLKSPLDLGYQVSRKVTSIIQQTPGTWRVGDVANVELTIIAKFDQPWVIVRDAVPAGASHLGTGLDGSSKILDRDPKSKGPEVEGWPTEFEEKSFANFISYAGYLPKGTYRTNYRIRLNSAGVFKMPPTHVEAMYAPESFGETPIADWKVEP